MNDRVPRVVIAGGGFGGLAAAKALGKAPARVLLIDRTNHHLFQPGQRGSRLIVNHHASAHDDARTPSAPERQPVGTR
jgi:NADH dehydrogenase FAD-containing subunit